MLACRSRSTVTIPFLKAFLDLSHSTSPGEGQLLQQHLGEEQTRNRCVTNRAPETANSQTSSSHLQTESACQEHNQPLSQHHRIRNTRLNRPPSQEQRTLRRPPPAPPVYGREQTSPVSKPRHNTVVPSSCKQHPGGVRSNCALLAEQAPSQRHLNTFKRSSLPANSPTLTDHEPAVRQAQVKLSRSTERQPLAFSLRSLPAPARRPLSQTTPPAHCRRNPARSSCNTALCPDQSERLEPQSKQPPQMLKAHTRQCSTDSGQSDWQAALNDF